jgi:hypothetical protein
MIEHISDNADKIKRFKNAEPVTLYLNNNTGKEINLHRPYIDRIYVP